MPGVCRLVVAPLRRMLEVEGRWEAYVGSGGAMGGVCWKWRGDGRRMLEVERRWEAYVGENSAMRGVCRLMVANGRRSTSTYASHRHPTSNIRLPSPLHFQHTPPIATPLRHTPRIGHHQSTYASHRHSTSNIRLPSPLHFDIRLPSPLHFQHTPPIAAPPRHTPPMAEFSPTYASHRLSTSNIRLHRHPSTSTYASHRRSTSNIRLASPLHFQHTPPIATPPRHTPPIAPPPPTYASHRHSTSNIRLPSPPPFQHTPPITTPLPTYASHRSTSTYASERPPPVYIRLASAPLHFDIRLPSPPHFDIRLREATTSLHTPPIAPPLPTYASHRHHTSNIRLPSPLHVGSGGAMGGVCWKYGADGRRMLEVEGRWEAYVDWWWPL